MSKLLVLFTLVGSFGVYIPNLYGETNKLSCNSVFDSSTRFGEWEKRALEEYYNKVNQEGPEISKESWQRVFDKITNGKSSPEDRATFQAAVGLKDIFSSPMIREILADELQIQLGINTKAEFAKTLSRFQSAPLREQMAIVDAVVERLTYLLGHDGSLKKQDSLDQTLQALRISHSSYKILQREWNKYKDFNFLPIRWALLIKIHSESSFRQEIVNTKSTWSKLRSTFTKPSSYLELRPPKIQEFLFEDFIIGVNGPYETKELKDFFDKLLPLSLIRFLEYRGQYLNLEQIELALSYLNKYQDVDSSYIAERLSNRREDWVKLIHELGPSMSDRLLTDYQYYSEKYFKSTLPENPKDLLDYPHTLKMEYFVPNDGPNGAKFSKLIEEISNIKYYSDARTGMRVIKKFIDTSNLKFSSKEFWELSISIMGVFRKYDRFVTGTRDAFLAGVKYLRKLSLSTPLNEKHKRSLHKAIAESAKDYRLFGGDWILRELDKPWGNSDLEVKNRNDEFKAVRLKVQSIAQAFGKYESDASPPTPEEVARVIKNLKDFSPLIEFKDIDQIMLEDSDSIYLEKGNQTKRIKNRKPTATNQKTTNQNNTDATNNLIKDMEAAKSAERKVSPTKNNKETTPEN